MQQQVQINIYIERKRSDINIRACSASVTSKVEQNGGCGGGWSDGEPADGGAGNGHRGGCEREERLLVDDLVGEMCGEWCERERSAVDVDEAHGAR